MPLLKFLPCASSWDSIFPNLLFPSWSGSSSLACCICLFLECPHNIVFCYLLIYLPVYVCLSSLLFFLSIYSLQVLPSILHRNLISLAVTLLISIVSFSVTAVNPFTGDVKCNIYICGIQTRRDKLFHMVLLSFEKRKNYVQKLSHSLEKQWDITNTPEHWPWMVLKIFQLGTESETQRCSRNIKSCFTYLCLQLLQSLGKCRPWELSV